MHRTRAYCTSVSVPFHEPDPLPNREGSLLGKVSMLTAGFLCDDPLQLIPVHVPVPVPVPVPAVFHRYPPP